jgi:hypothetical protein
MNQKNYFIKPVQSSTENNMLLDERKNKQITLFVDATEHDRELQVKKATLCEKKSCSLSVNKRFLQKCSESMPIIWIFFRV